MDWRVYLIGETAYIFLYEKCYGTVLGQPGLRRVMAEIARRIKRLEYF